MEPERANLVKETERGLVSKEALVYSSPKDLRAVLSPVAWRIVRHLSAGPAYPSQLARDLGLYRQKVYYYVKKLRDAGIIKPVGRRGAGSTTYSATSEALALDLGGPGRAEESLRPVDEPLASFLGPFVREGVFNGRIVVGSPDPHGPSRTMARDGHYGAQLGMFLGRFCTPGEDFAVLLDVDLRPARAETENLILIGGPGTNLISAEVNRLLPVRFNEGNYWAGLIDPKGRNYSSEADGLVARIRSPFSDSRFIVLLAGNRNVGTKTAVLGLTRYWKSVLADFRGQEPWAAVLRGFDLNADGKIDSVERLY